ncbi:MAG: SGNH/GDSL hydrolase family protein, partial [Clostridia bacterium]|nr:SGNH/GDSL hydrolase family protein [Clostridia bacterium]
MKLLCIGNSITLHFPAPAIGWHGSWGMAASAPENDYAHRLTAMLRAAGKTVDLRLETIVATER